MSNSVRSDQTSAARKSSHGVRVAARRSQGASVQKDHTETAPATPSGDQTISARKSSQCTIVTTRRSRSMCVHEDQSGTAPATKRNGQSTSVQKDHRNTAVARRSREWLVQEDQGGNAPATSSADQPTRARKSSHSTIVSVNGGGRGPQHAVHTKGPAKQRPPAAVPFSHLLRHRTTTFEDLITEIRDKWREHVGLERVRISVSNRISADERREAFIRCDAAGTLPYRVFPEVVDADKWKVKKARWRLYSIFDQLEAFDAEVDKELRHLVDQLPVARDFIAQTTGFNQMSLAGIVGHAGDIGNYKGYAQLWKRMGVGLVNGKPQRKVSTAGVSPDGKRIKISWDEAMEIGYNGERRAWMHVIGESLFKPQGFYRELYLQRKKIEVAKAAAAGLTVLPSAKITAKNRATSMSDGHVHTRALRYIEKKLLRRLWAAWRATALADGAIVAIPPMKQSRRKLNGG